MVELAQQFAPEIMGPTAPQEAIVAATTSMAAVPEATWRQIMQCLVRFDMREEWTAQVHPVCLIAGEKDNNAPARTMVCPRSNGAIRALRN